MIGPGYRTGVEGSVGSDELLAGASALIFSVPCSTHSPLTSTGVGAAPPGGGIGADLAGFRTGSSSPGPCDAASADESGAGGSLNPELPRVGGAGAGPFREDGGEPVGVPVGSNWTLPRAGGAGFAGATSADGVAAVLGSATFGTEPPRTGGAGALLRVGVGGGAFLRVGPGGPVPGGPIPPIIAPSWLEKSVESRFASPDLECRAATTGGPAAETSGDGRREERRGMLSARA